MQSVGGEMMDDAVDELEDDVFNSLISRFATITHRSSKLVLSKDKRVSRQVGERQRVENEEPNEQWFAEFVLSKHESSGKTTNFIKCTIQSVFKVLYSPNCCSNFSPKK